MLHPNDDKDADPDEKPSERFLIYPISLLICQYRWRPCITAEQIFDAVIAMLSSPNPSSPANMEADVTHSLFEKLVLKYKKSRSSINSTTQVMKLKLSI